MNKSRKYYAERDVDALDEQGGYYFRHVDAMTREGLHSKSQIAAELAFRDAEIDKLRKELASRPTTVNVEGLKEWAESKTLCLFDFDGEEVNAVGIEELIEYLDSLTPLPTPVSVELSDMQYVSEVITEADDLLVQIENIAHNEIGDWVTDARGKIQDGLKYIRSLTPHPELSGEECKHLWVGTKSVRQCGKCATVEFTGNISVSPPKTHKQRGRYTDKPIGQLHTLVGPVITSPPKTEGDKAIKALEEVMEEIEKTPTSFGYGSGDSGILKNIISETIRSKITQLQSESKAEGKG